jgi:hypothetical protein
MAEMKRSDAANLSVVDAGGTNTSGLDNKLYGLYVLHVEPGGARRLAL